MEACSIAVQGRLYKNKLKTLRATGDSSINTALYARTNGSRDLCRCSLIVIVYISRDRKRNHGAVYLIWQKTLYVIGGEQEIDLYLTSQLLSKGHFEDHSEIIIFKCLKRTRINSMSMRLCYGDLAPIVSCHVMLCRTMMVFKGTSSPDSSSICVTVKCTLGLARSSFLGRNVRFDGCVTSEI